MGTWLPDWPITVSAFGAPPANERPVFGSHLPDWPMAVETNNGANGRPMSFDAPIAPSNQFRLCIVAFSPSPFRVLPSFTEFYRVLPSFSEFQLVQTSFTEFSFTLAWFC